MKLTPCTKRIIVVSIAVIIVTAMFTGNFDAIVEIVKSLVK